MNATGQRLNQALLLRLPTHGPQSAALRTLGFEIVTAEGRQAHVWFSETDPIRSLSGAALTDALLDKIGRESTAPRPKPEH
jgi:hypothetical protein